MRTATQDRVRELFDYRSDGELIWKVDRSRKIHAGDVAGTHGAEKYHTVRFDYDGHYRHRIVFLWHYGYLPEQIDHINLDRHDNRIENLRSVTRSGNQWNRAPGCGVRKIRNKWQARIAQHGERTDLGFFGTEEAAHTAYREAKARRDATI